MTDHKTDSATTVGPITDPESLRGRVPIHEDTDVVPAETVEAIAEADDMAIVGITNAEDEVLLRRLTSTCSWKLPVALVEDGEDYAAAIDAHVTETIGTVELAAVEGVWQLDVRAEDGSDTASRAFVVFSGDLSDESLAPPADGVEDVGWFDHLPENGSELPGAELFL